MSAHRRVRPAHHVVAGRVVLSGAAVVGMGAGPLVGLAAAAPTVHTTCSSYRYQEDAQAALTAGGHGNLDGDSDGIACESLPHRGTTTAPVASKPVVSKPAASTPATKHTGTTTTRAVSSSASSTRSAITDLDRGDFTTQAQAQRVLDRDSSDPNRLDADHDGVACESYAYGTTSSSSVRPVADTSSATADSPVPQVGTVPVGAVAAGDGSTEGGGSDALWYGLLTTAAVAGAAGAHQFVGGRHRRRA